MNHFSQHSEQVHSSFREGKGHTRRNIVNIQNGKGKKIVEICAANGKIEKRNEKALTKKEMECIERNKFIPGLFRDCLKEQPREKASKTRRKAKQAKAKSQK